MCGRNSLFLSTPELEERFEATLSFDAYEPRYNIAPSTRHPVITNDNPEAIIVARWGFLPSWQDGSSNGLINARSESAHEKRTFRDAWQHRSCLVPSTGFYEWQAIGSNAKQPYRIHLTAEPAFSLAGLWEFPSTDASADLPTMTILTTDASETVEPIHDRMPVILPRSAESEWLTAGPDRRKELCRPYTESDLEAYPIDTAVNDPSTDDPSVIDRIGTEQGRLDRFGA